MNPIWCENDIDLDKRFYEAMDADAANDEFIYARPIVENAISSRLSISSTI